MTLWEDDSSSPTDAGDAARDGRLLSTLRSVSVQSPSFVLLNSCYSRNYSTFDRVSPSEGWGGNQKLLIVVGIVLCIIAGPWFYAYGMPRGNPPAYSQRVDEE